MKSVFVGVKADFFFGKEVRYRGNIVSELEGLVVEFELFVNGELSFEFVGGVPCSHPIKDLTNKNTKQFISQIQIMSQEVDPSKVREISLAQKKEIMWNVIEPGDPYDIRKYTLSYLDP